MYDEKICDVTNFPAHSWTHLSSGVLGTYFTDGLLTGYKNFSYAIINGAK